VLVTQRQRGRLSSTFIYDFALTDSEKRNLPGEPFQHFAKKRIGGFSARWNRAGVEMFSTDQGETFLQSGRVTDGRQVWTMARRGQIQILSVAQQIHAARPQATTASSTSRTAD